MPCARVPGDAVGFGLRALQAQAGYLSPSAAAGRERGGAGSAAGPRRPRARPARWRRGDRGRWRVRRGRGAPADDPGARRAGLGPRSGAWAPGLGGAGPAGPAEGGARADPEGAGPRRGAGSGGPSVTHAAVREAAAAVAAGAAGTGTGARARAGAGCLPPLLAFRLRGSDRPSALGKEEGGPRTPTSSLSSRGSQLRRRLRLRRGSSAPRSAAHGQSVRGGERPGLSLSAGPWAGIP